MHSHIEHLLALLELAQREGMAERTWIHAFTDGRDVSPTSAVRDLAELPDDRIATISGRYYAMDRDKRWERTQLALDALSDQGQGAPSERSAVALVQASYDNDVTDEFIVPVWREGRPALEPGARRGDLLQLPPRPDAAAVGEARRARRRRDDDDEVPGGLRLSRRASRNSTSTRCSAEVLAEAGVRQLHMAETEKYAHVTYFFNGGREDEFEGETRMLVPSPRDVPSYDHKPEMSAVELADAFVEKIGDGYAFAVINFANPDMVGHTGVIPAVVRAVETADTCLGRVVEAVTALGGVCLVTADHGNAEKMLEDDGVSPHTAHTTNLVPLLLTEKALKLRGHGELSDLAPTILAALGFARPLQMSGENLIEIS